MQDHNKALAATLFIAGLLSTSTSEGREVNSGTFSLPLVYFERLSIEQPEALSRVLERLEERANGEIQVSVHEEDGAVDLSCFDCNVTELERGTIQLAAWNEFGTAP